MATLRISSTLVRLMPSETAPDGRRARVDIGATTWPEVVEEMRSRFPQLASRVLDGDDIAPAFVLVVNDDVVRHPDPSLCLDSRDELTLLASIAGG